VPKVVSDCLRRDFPTLVLSGQFARHQRLTRPAEYQLVFTKSKRFGDKELNILSRANQQPFARLGIVVPRKHIRKANARNRVKRQVRESFRWHQEMLKGWDIVVLLRADLGAMSNAVLRERLEKYWQHIARTCAPS
jgi:ribonuclease P protein component